MLSLLAAFSISGFAWAKNDVVPQVHRDIHRILQEQQDVALKFQAMVDSAGSILGEAPLELYPTLDLYSEWNDDYNPVVNEQVANLPSSLDINLSGWYAPIKGQITSPYGWRHRRMHKGSDIKLYVGDTVRAAFDGRVRIRRYERRGYGNYYVIRHDNGLETIYGHLSKHLVQQDQYVKAGQAIGLGGSTGRSTGPHLHFEMRYAGIALDPSDLINFDTFEPYTNVYHLDRKRAEWAQKNKGKRGARYRGASTTKSGTNDGTQEVASSKGSKKAKGKNDNASSSKGSVHTIRKGDTLSAIALRYGTTVNKLCKLNHIKANTKLQLGKKLKYK